MAEGQIGRLGDVALANMQDRVQKILEVHTRYDDLRNKMNYIDVNYHRYQTSTQKSERDAAGNVPCGVTVDNMLIPLVISQVDSATAYWAEVFLSGYPLFPIVSTPKSVVEADAMEAIVDTHSILGSGYARNLLKAFRLGARYNFMPILNEWREIDYYDVVTSYLNPTEAAKMQKNKKGYTCIHALDPYNTIWDYRVSPADVSAEGEFVGYIERVGRIKLKKLILKLQAERCLYNYMKIKDLPSSSNVATRYWTDPPAINDILSFKNKSAAGDYFDWPGWMGVEGPNKKVLQQSSYELTVLYIRVIPEECDISVPNKNIPQMFKLWVLNGHLIIGFKRILTVMDRFPIEIGMPIEDNFEIQTQSIAEAQAGFQEAASTLWNVQLQGARRAVMDRAIYDADILNKNDVNSKHPSAKMPARLKGLTDRKLSDAYYAIPYDATALQGIIQSIGQIMEYADMSSGQNKPFRGQFQKGNKSVEEWRDTTGNADSRMRLPVINIEMQCLVPVKENIKFNIFQYGAIGTFQNFKTGDTVTITAEMLESMRTKALSFRVADGYTPKSKMASTDAMQTLLQGILSSEPLMMQYGDRLPGLVAHLAQLLGIRDLDQYSPTIQGATDGQPPVGTQSGAAAGNATPPQGGAGVPAA